MAYKSDPEIFDEAYRLYTEGQIEQSYALLSESATRYPSELLRTYEWRFDMAAKMGNLELAESILKEALDAGFFYSEFALRKDDDLQVMQGRPAFEALVERDLAILADEQKRALPLLEVLYHGKDSAKSKPLLMALHGNNSNVEKFRQYWGALWNTEWLVALPQSSQVSGKGNYVWNDMAKVEVELKDHFAGLCADYGVDPTRTIISGFSKGGQAAIETAFKGWFPVSGFLAVAPYISDRSRLAPYFASIQNKALRGYIVAGGKDDECLSSATWLHEEMKKHGLCCEIKVYPEMAHDFPDDFDSVLPEILRFLLGG